MYDEEDKIEGFRDELMEITLKYLKSEELEYWACIPALLKTITDLTVEIGDA